MHGLFAIGRAAGGFAEILQQQHTVARLQFGTIALKIKRLRNSGDELRAAGHLQFAARTGTDDKRSLGSDHGARCDFQFVTQSVTRGQLLPSR